MIEIRTNGAGACRCPLGIAGTYTRRNDVRCSACGRLVHPVTISTSSTTSSLTGNVAMTFGGPTPWTWAEEEETND